MPRKSARDVGSPHGVVRIAIRCSVRKRFAWWYTSLLLCSTPVRSCDIFPCICLLFPMCFGGTSGAVPEIPRVGGRPTIDYDCAFDDLRFRLMQCCLFRTQLDIIILGENYGGELPEGADYPRARCEAQGVVRPFCPHAGFGLGVLENLLNRTTCVKYGDSLIRKRWSLRST